MGIFQDVRTSLFHVIINDDKLAILTQILAADVTNIGHTLGGRRCQLDLKVALCSFDRLI